jgi:hypothetical protein
MVEMKEGFLAEFPKNDFSTFLQYADDEYTYLRKATYQNIARVFSEAPNNLMIIQDFIVNSLNLLSNFSVNL